MERFFLFIVELISHFADGDLLSFACPKERRQEKGTPDKPLFPFFKNFS
ncbi:hypothetical protein ANH9381_2150 [Aggregatibacter actinomycetemcomitans ANH9381]|nr:hypothetical protein ANH9381_2150 [Aggregatibacter actinomycetemcomitans ANH9381]